MLTDLLNTITNLISDYPNWAGAIVFLVAMIESLAIIGIIVPGVAIMFAIGVLISNGALDLIATTLWAAAGASFGDGLSFALGWHYKERIYHVSFLKKYQHLFTRGHQFFEKYGVFSILIGRFVGPIRAIIPLIAGILDMPLKQYIPINIIASILWAPAYLFPGLIFASAISNAPDGWVTRWPVGLGLFIVIALLFWIIKKKKLIPK
ncbi:MAG: phosphoesterase PA-phosphatase [Cycloclasticus sp. symbiont of Poecilosclerida sp. M]|nr:MAG: phosphoesterase PA-phosphatase [Cycloclasticus sp. symbiont of Poecilosclerida sp. M]